MAKIITLMKFAIKKPFVILRKDSKWAKVQEMLPRILELEEADFAKPN